MIAGVVAYAGAAIWWNAGILSDGSANLTGVSNQVRAELGAVVLAGSALPANVQPDPQLMPQVQAGPFQAAAAAFGSPGDSRRNLEDRADPYGALVDAMLLRGRPMTVTRTSVPVLATACSTLPVAAGAPAQSFDLRAGGAVVKAPPAAALAVRVRSFAPTFPDEPVATILPGTAALISWSPRATAVRGKSS